MIRKLVRFLLLVHSDLALSFFGILHLAGIDIFKFYLPRESLGFATKFSNNSLKEEQIAQYTIRFYYR